MLHKYSFFDMRGMQDLLALFLGLGSLAAGHPCTLIWIICLSLYITSFYYYIYYRFDREVKEWITYPGCLGFVVVNNLSTTPIFPASWMNFKLRSLITFSGLEKSGYSNTGVIENDKVYIENELTFRFVRDNWRRNWNSVEIPGI